MIYAFNIQIPTDVHDYAKSRRVEIKGHHVIYHLVNDLRDELSKLLPPIIDKKAVAAGHVIKEFVYKMADQKVPIAGTRIDHGIFKKYAHFCLY